MFVWHLLLGVFAVSADPPASGLEGRAFSRPARVKTAEFLKRTTYDHIVVGGGASGCPLVRTLVDAGKNVLLVERGGPREEYLDSLSMKGAGVVVDIPEISQPVTTTQGVRSHIGNVLSGGTALGMAIMIEETNDYFHTLAQGGAEIDVDKMRQAYEFVRKEYSQPMLYTKGYGDAWREGLQNSGFDFKDYQYQIHTNGSWGGYSHFESDGHQYRRAADVVLNPIKYAPNFDLLLRHVVERVTFDDTPGAAPRATCVLLRPSEPSKPIGLSTVSLWGIPTPPVFIRLRDFIRNSFFGSEEAAEVFEVCLNDDPESEIMLSAGAILSPLLLYRSGVGPIDQVRNAGADLVAEHPTLGQNVTDRVFIPIGMFQDVELPPDLLPGRICQTVGLKLYGPDCSEYKVNHPSEKCSAVTVEEISGARVAEGVIYATRFVVPPERRNDPIFSTILNIISRCANPDRSGVGLFGEPVCAITRPIYQCFQKVAANFYFVAEPASRGSIRIAEDGDVFLDANYMGDPEDLDAAARGLKVVLDVINSKVYDGIMEPSGPNSCVARIFNGVLDLARRMDMEARNEINSLQSGGVRGVIRDIFGGRQMSEVLEEGDALKRAEQLLPVMEYSEQKYASYPPSLPDPNDPTSLKAYVQNYMTSMWHWCGSAQLGRVVDSDFRVKGVDRLAVIDASVLPRITRMNPTATLLALGRYAGIRRVGV